MVFKPIAWYLTNLIYQTIERILKPNGDYVSDGNLLDISKLEDVTYGVDGMARLFNGYPVILMNNKALLEDIIQCRLCEKELAKKLQADEHGLLVLMQSDDLNW
eukprot:86636_1